MAQKSGIADEAEAALKFEGKLPGEMQQEYRERILPFMVNAGE